MNRFAAVGKLTLLSLLIFANSFLLLAQSDSIYRLPSGTKITVKMDAEINSQVASVNDTFLATVAKPVAIRESVVVPIGTVIEGRVLKVAPAAGGGRGGKLEVVFETLKISGETRRIEGVPLAPMRAASSGTSTFLSIVGGVAVGAILGAVSRADRGTLIGAGIGAGAGDGPPWIDPRSASTKSPREGKWA